MFHHNNILNAFLDRFSRNIKNAYLVGGAIRNTFLDQKVNDFDNTTNTSIQDHKLIL